MSKKDLLNNLFNETYCRIQPSKISGVGVFAIKDIPKGVNPFKVAGIEQLKYNLINIKESDLKGLDKNVKKMLFDFLGSNKSKSYPVPKLGLNSLDISFYMNHSNSNNVGLNFDPEDDDDELFTFLTIKKIKKGEELTINYNNY